MSQTNLPGTNTSVTKSFDDRLLDVVEFDDALLDQAIWKNPRYEGCKATSKTINKYTPTDKFIDTKSTSSGEYLGQYVKALGRDNEDVTVWGGDISYGLNPVIQNETTALYIVNTVVGGTEDKQFAQIENHSYLGINKIIIVSTKTRGVQVLERSAEGFEEFHRFITNDLPTGGKFGMKVIDASISNKVQNNYNVKMNKGWLLNSFDFNYTAPTRHPSLDITCSLETNNSMYLYQKGTKTNNIYLTGSYNASNGVTLLQNNDTRFRYALINMQAASSDNTGPLFGREYMGPSFASSSIINNKFTRKFYSGSFGYISDSFVGEYNNDRLASSGLGSASRFIGLNCLSYLKTNNENPKLTEKEKTEIHITFFKGTKDFAPGYNDERSISTFEVDQNQTSLDIGDHCNDFLPQNHEIRFKGTDDHRFTPTTSTFSDDIHSNFLEHTASVAYDSNYPNRGCTHKSTLPGQFVDPSETTLLQPGVNVDVINDLECWVQGGALGMWGYQGNRSSSHVDYSDSNDPSQYPYNGTATSDNNYSGNFDYQLSFLDKDHTIIADVDKDAELFDGIGDKGLVIIPEHLHIDIKSNIDYYLKKAGLINDAPPDILPIQNRER